MKINKVFYEKLFPTGSFQNERIGMEASLDDGEDEHEALAILKNQVEKFHRDSNPNYVEGTPIAPVLECQVDRGDPTKALIQDIDTCKEVKVLETYRFMVKGNQQLSEAYDRKMEELNSKK